MSLSFGHPLIWAQHGLAIADSRRQASGQLTESVMRLMEAAALTANIQLLAYSSLPGLKRAKHQSNQTCVNQNSLFAISEFLTLSKAS